MSEDLTFGKPVNKRLSPGEKLKYEILGNRLGISGDNAQLLLEDLHKETSNIFSIPESTISSDIDFAGREFDIVFTINKQNTPKNKV